MSGKGPSSAVIAAGALGAFGLAYAASKAFASSPPPPSLPEIPVPKGKPKLQNPEKEKVRGVQVALNQYRQAVIDALEHEGMGAFEPFQPTFLCTKAGAIAEDGSWGKCTDAATYIVSEIMRISGSAGYIDPETGHVVDLPPDASRDECLARLAAFAARPNGNFTFDERRNAQALWTMIQEDYYNNNKGQAHE